MSTARSVVPAYISFLCQIPWENNGVFGTFTYPTQVGPQKAIKTFTSFFQPSYCILCGKSYPITWWRADEQRVSGLGKPPCGLHHHFVAVSPHLHPLPLLSPKRLEWIWNTSVALRYPVPPEGSRRGRNACEPMYSKIDPATGKTIRVFPAGSATKGDKSYAEVAPYDPTRRGLAYLLKLITDDHCDYSFSNLDLFLGHPAEPAPNARQRRALRRKPLQEEWERKHVSFT